MTTRWCVVRALLVTLAALLVVPLAPGAAVAEDQQASSPKTPSSSAAILDLVGCIQSRRHLTVQMLIDESGSLHLTDPQNRRVDAALAALDGLVSLAAGGGTGATRVDVALAAFANRYRTVRDWTSVSTATQPALRSAIEGFRARNTGTDTDFVNALSGARRSLARQAATVTANGGQAPCKAVLLFTDGKYDLAVRKNKRELVRFGRTKPYAPGIVLDNETAVRKVEAAGRTELCRRGGLADGLRSDEISLLTVALSATVPVAEQRLLASVSAGSADGVTCGTPTDVPPGAYLPAAQVDVLISRFDEIATRLGGGTLLPDQAVTLCAGSPCAAGTRTIAVDRSIRRLHLLALAPKPGMVINLVTPSGKVTIDKDGTVSAGAAQAQVRVVAGRGWSIDVDRPASGTGWAGTWTATLVDTSGKQGGKRATLDAYVYSDLGISLAPVGALVRGQPRNVLARIVVPKGVDPKKLVSSATVTLRLTDPVTGRSTVVPLGGSKTGIGPFTGSFTPPASYTSSSYDVVAELQANMADGAQIVARSVPVTAMVRRPVGSLQMVPPSLDFPSLTGSGSTTSKLVLLGALKPGCVWFVPPKTTVPGGAGPLAITYAGSQAHNKATCLRVDAGKQLAVDVVVTPAGRSTGTVKGALEVHEQADGGAETVTLIPFGFEMSRGVNQARRLLLAVLLLIGGLLLPIVLLYIVNTVSARFQSLDHVQAAVIPVSVQNGRTLRLDSARNLRPFRMTPADFQSLAGRGGPRRFVFGGIEFRAVASPNPFGSTIALAAPEGGAAEMKGREGSRVELDPYLVGSWVLLLDPDRTRVRGGEIAEGALIVFLAEGRTADQIARLMPDITNRVPVTAARLAKAIVQQPAQAARPAQPV